MAHIPSSFPQIHYLTMCVTNSCIIVIISIQATSIFVQIAVPNIFPTNYYFVSITDDSLLYSRSSSVNH